MKLAMQSKFIKSATELSQCPQDGLKEVVFLGRSNAGKSSLINGLLNRKALAKVSGTPGKTRLMNFFLIDESYRFVDLPGYGFAKRAPGELEMWAAFIEEYLLNRENLVGLVLVMDIRREWSDDEQLIYNLSFNQQIPGFLALTKSDKLSKNKVKLAVENIKKCCPIWDIKPISNLKKLGVKELHQEMFKAWKLNQKIKKST